ncbi:CD63 antigen-like [Sitodiplosis mosellana]|uniref:CD63 antigen-like n=1 Tax=Sitodiplosis mosellana TaxID=263140 RepID=UPI002444A24F|nr:CD63 antigen-like [Sitodiplosis mosellana]
MAQRRYLANDRGKTHGGCDGIARAYSFIFNVVLAGISFVLCGFCASGLYEYYDLQIHGVQILYHTILALAIFFAVLFLVALLAVYSIAKSDSCLNIFLSLMSAVMILLVVTVSIFIYSNKRVFIENLERLFNEVESNYGANYKFLELLQNQLNCCGATNNTAAELRTVMPTLNCDTTRNSCITVIESFFVTYSNHFPIVSLSLGITKVIDLVCCLYLNSRSNSYKRF